MKIEEALILWNPRSDQVKVSVWRHITVAGHRVVDIFGWDNSYLFNDAPSWQIGAAMTKGNKLKRIARLFVIFNTMVVRDGVAVDAAHRALLAIDEYRETIPEDQEGAAP
jgi:hypothetical protein